MKRISRALSFSMPASFSMLLWEIHSSFSVSATPSSPSIFLMLFRPSDRISSESMPETEVILSIVLVESESFLHFFSVESEASSFAIGGMKPYSFTVSSSSRGLPQIANAVRVVPGRWAVGAESS